MKYPTAVNNQTREAVSLSPKLSATFSEVFANSPKANIKSTTQAKSSQKLLSATLNCQVSEKRSSSKIKCDTLRTISSSPRTAVPYKAAESVRKEDTSYKYKKLEISTDFKNTYSASKVQTTKHTESDENSATLSRTSKNGSQSAQKAQSSYSLYTQQAEIKASIFSPKTSSRTASVRKEKTESASNKRPLSAKKLNKEDEKTQGVSLQSFVTQVKKGEVFSSIKSYGDKRDDSVNRTQKPQLNLDEKSSKPVRAVDIDLKGSKTTTNIESKVVTVSLGKNTSQSPKGIKTSKQGSLAAREALKPSQEAARTKAPKDAFTYYMTYLEKAHKWTDEPDYFVQLYREHFLQSHQALNFCKVVKRPDSAVIAQKRVNLPRKDIHKDKRTLVFDMDETLIHCNESLEMPADVVLPITFPTGEVVEAGINIRPYALEILKELSQFFEIIVFTASQACYANVVLDHLDPKGEYIQHRLYRESCVVTAEGLHVKDLRVIGNRNIEDLILIDNAAYSYAFQMENGIPIVPFYDNKDDQELRHLIPYLKSLSTVKDIREINKQTFKLHHFASYEDPEQVLEKVILQA